MMQSIHHLCRNCKSNVKTNANRRLCLELFGATVQWEVKLSWLMDSNH